MSQEDACDSATDASAGSALDSRPGLRSAPRDPQSSFRKRCSKRPTAPRVATEQSKEARRNKSHRSRRELSVKDRCNKVERRRPRSLPLLKPQALFSNIVCVPTEITRLLAQGLARKPQRREEQDKKRISVALLAPMWPWQIRSASKQRRQALQRPYCFLLATVYRIRLRSSAAGCQAPSSASVDVPAERILLAIDTTVSTLWHKRPSP